MPVQNTEIARMFEQVADLLAIQAANPFRVRAYRNAARTVRSLAEPLHTMLAAGADLAQLPGIGKDLAGRIAAIVRTGRCAILDRLARATPKGLLELLRLPGLGPRRVAALQRALGIADAGDLLRAARAHRVRALPGFGPRTEAAIVAALGRRAPGAERRTLWAEAAPIAARLVTLLAAAEHVGAVEVAGSFRRRRETVGDLDVLVAAAHGDAAIERFVGDDDVDRVLARGHTKAAVVLRNGLQVDLRVVAPEAFGAALVYFTGSKAHNIRVRRLGRERGLKINEYGVFRGARRVAGHDERSVYRAVAMAWVPPELREDRGEVEAARRRRLPRLLEAGDLRGDLHSHTRASDGTATIGEMAAAAKALGREYLAIADHTHAARIAHGLGPRAMRAHLRRIAAADGKVRGLRLLRAAEVDIREDGSLDLPDDLLAELDVVVCAVHTGFRLSRAKQTERILRAMDHERCQILAHPTGRLLGAREPYAVDLERVVAGAAERGCCLELNAQPQRLDLPDVWLAAARAAGVRIAISSDAHSTQQLALLELGAGYARRGWLTAADVINTRPWAEVRRLLRR